MTGPNQPMVTSKVVKAFTAEGLALSEVNHLAFGDRLTFTLQVEETGGDATIQGAVDRLDLGADFTVDISAYGEQRPADRSRVTVVGERLSAAGVPAVTDEIARAGAQLDGIRALGPRDNAYQLDVSGIDTGTLHRILRDVPALRDLDIAVQDSGQHRQHLIVLDVDQTFIQNEVIELLAAEAGTLDRVTEVTERAMLGELDFEASLHERVALLEGLDEGVFDRVYDKIELTPGVPIMVMTAQEHGDEIGLISGGFTQITDRLADEWGIKREYTAANTLEVVDGRLTGRVVGPVVDRAAKATKLQEFAGRARIPIARTIAIGDGANDLDMINTAGLGIAFHAKPVVRAAAPTALTKQDMTPVLYLRGIPYGDFAAPAQRGAGERPDAAHRSHRPADAGMRR